MNCCICGPVRNCGAYLKKVLQNIEKIGSLFEDYKIVIYYDKSKDNSLAILKEYQKTNPKLHLYVNQDRVSPFRTHNIAIARNFCLNFVRNNKDLFPYFIMMDFDDVNCKEVDLNVLEKYIKS
jgi:glycosyltransferase involved in cell wall biosynthesis